MNEELHSNAKKGDKNICFNYLPEASCLALNPLLYFLTPVNGVVTGVRSQISAGSNTHTWIFLFCDWLRELLCCQSKDLTKQKREQIHDYTYLYQITNCIKYEGT